MDTVSIAGERYVRPWTHRPPTVDELAYLRQSVAELGIRTPVLTCTTPEFGRTLIQGYHRVTVAAELGIVPPVIDLGTMPAETAQKIAHDVQAAGRQLSPGEVEQARRARAERIVAKRAAGITWREIAAAEGISSTGAQKIARKHVSSSSSGKAPASPAQARSGGGGGPVATADPRCIDHDAAEQAAKHVRHTVPRLGDDLAWLLTTSHGPAVRDAAKRAGHPIPDQVVEWPPLVVLSAAFSAALS